MIATAPPQVSGLFGVPPQVFSRSPASRRPAATGPASAAPSPVAGRMGGPLGGSMRAPFDYAAALRAMAGNQGQPSRTQMIAGTVGDILATAGGGRASFLPGLQAQRHEQAQRLNAANRQVLDWQQADWARQNAADLSASAPFTIGRSRLQFDPATGQTDALYTGPEDFDLYAAGLGLQPGTEDYFNAVEDYVLRSNGPSAFTRDVQLDDHRTGNDLRLEGVRQSNRIGLEDHRQGNRIELRGVPQARSAPAPRASRRADDIPTVNSPDEARRLPPGSQFRTRDGRTMRVPAR
ncbi:hypothetical protein [Alteraurantiacibacter buctensis]|uniref:Uncharacterized protein n=1 Tax=Alteraurantiacibacter buctensis TaxID=1503981 RepID=A0A844YZB3_9SPHN|nr:hypothetical protein [Alteraurantiacibacter buctensis]MXO72366.1 hypothetical protein [Alteraurantiacibacter buctensis]